jgi:hypothetical protein
MNKNIRKIYKSSLEHYRKLSFRERMILLSLSGVLAVIAAVSIYQPINAAFIAQHKRIEDSERSAASAGQLIDRYLKLKSQRNIIESQYQQAEIHEGEITYIENMAKTKIGLPSSAISISPISAKPFGTNYEQAPFTVKFSVTSVKGLVDFFHEVVAGPHPLVLSRIEIRRPLSGDKLDVDLELNSIRSLKPDSNQGTRDGNTVQPPNA